MRPGEIVLPLTKEEKVEIFQHRNSHLYKLFRKAISFELQKNYALLLNADKDDLPHIQGMLKGLNTALNLPEFAGAEGEEIKRLAEQVDHEAQAPSKAAPLVSAAERRRLAEEAKKPKAP